MGKLRGILKKPLVLVLIGLVIIFVGTAATWAFYNSDKATSSSTSSDQNQTQSQTQAKSQPKAEKKSETPKTYPYTLVAYKGTVFGAKVPKGWKITDN